MQRCRSTLVMKTILIRSMTKNSFMLYLSSDDKFQEVCTHRPGGLSAARATFFNVRRLLSGAG